MLLCFLPVDIDYGGFLRLIFGDRGFGKGDTSVCPCPNLCPNLVYYGFCVHTVSLRFVLKVSHVRREPRKVLLRDA